MRPLRIVIGTLLLTGCSAITDLDGWSFHQDDGDVDAGDDDAGSPGVDAGRFDAGEMIDGGTDGGMPDAGTDAGTDAGMITVTQISVGSLHSCALFSDGSVSCWGDNRVGQLGDGTQFNRYQPMTVDGFGPASSIDSAADSTCAITRTGELWCWGGNGFAQLGDGTHEDRLDPVRISVDGVQQLSGGGGHTCALLGPDDVRCWGLNTRGQIGDGTQNEALTPTPPMGMTGVTALSTDNGQHTCAIVADGALRCWGDNGTGQLGNGTTGLRLMPVDVPGLIGISRVAVNIWHTCALRTGGQLYCWGQNTDGRLGDGTTMNRSMPTLISSLPSVTRIAVGRYASCAGTSDGMLHCWGSNSRGQLGQGAASPATSSTPLPVAGGTRPLEISGGREHFCARMEGGRVLCWGDNSSGQLGFDPTIADRSNAPVEVTF